MSQLFILHYIHDMSVIVYQFMSIIQTHRTWSLILQNPHLRSFYEKWMGKQITFEFSWIRMQLISVIKALHTIWGVIFNDCNVGLSWNTQKKNCACKHFPAILNEEGSGSIVNCVCQFTIIVNSYFIHSNIKCYSWYPFPQGDGESDQAKPCRSCHETYGLIGLNYNQCIARLSGFRLRLDSFFPAPDQIHWSRLVMSQAIVTGSKQL